MPLEFKTMEYLDLKETLDHVEKISKRPDLAIRVWRSLFEQQFFNGQDSFGYVPIEDSHEKLIDFYGQQLGDDYEAIKQAVSHIPIKKMRWLASY